VANIQIVLVGREGKLTAAIQERIQQHEWQSVVLITGHRADVSSILAAADVFVFPSRFEGLPGALIEAEAASLPIICSDIANNREVAESANAMFIPLDTPSKLAHAISTLATDKTYRSRLGTYSLSVFQERFQIDAIHNRMEQLLQKLIA
jgi:glycosyltransferase involved in cell wall biosynthesis